MISSLRWAPDFIDKFGTVRSVFPILRIGQSSRIASPAMRNANCINAYTRNRNKANFDDPQRNDKNSLNCCTPCHHPIKLLKICSKSQLRYITIYKIGPMSACTWIISSGNRIMQVLRFFLPNTLQHSHTARARSRPIWTGIFYFSRSRLHSTYNLIDIFTPTYQNVLRNAPNTIACLVTFLKYCHRRSGENSQLAVYRSVSSRQTVWKASSQLSTSWELSDLC